jgi:hypothetical protein
MDLSEFLLGFLDLGICEIEEETNERMLDIYIRWTKKVKENLRGLASNPALRIDIASSCLPTLFVQVYAMNLLSHDDQFQFQGRGELTYQISV